MPWLEYVCGKCEFKFDKVKGVLEEEVLCPLCGGVCVRLLSVPASRRDHTVLELEKR